MEKKLLYKALAASSGQAGGKVRIVRNASDTGKFRQGEILVATMTDPTMVIMMGKAAGIITDSGGLTCHAAIVSREMGIPCVVATKTATKELHTGDEVYLNGDSGEVYIVTNSSHG